MKIASKTKLTQYAIKEGCESLSLEVCDFSDGQVEALERCVRYPEDTVIMTVSDPTDGDIAPMEFRVKIGPVQLQRKGQKVPLTEFNGRTEHTVKLRKLVKAGAVVIVTFEQIRKQMTLEEAAKEKDPAPETEGRSQIQRREIKVPAAYRSSVTMELYLDGDGRHRARAAVTIPGMKTPMLSLSEGAETAAEAICGCVGKVQDWLHEQTTFSKQTGLEKIICDDAKEWVKEHAK